MSVRFEASTEADIDQIKDWLALDDSKPEGLPAEYWLTGSNGILVCRVSDDEGVVLYLRCEMEDDLIRFHALFIPGDTNRKRIAVLLTNAFPQFFQHMVTEYCAEGMVMMTGSEDLARFMTTKFGFERVEGTNDYVLKTSLEPVAVDCGTF